VSNVFAAMLQLGAVAAVAGPTVAFAASPADAPLPTVASALDVSNLYEAGVPEGRILAAIYASPPFACTPEQLELLRITGASQPVIATLARRSIEATTPDPRLAAHPQAADVAAGVPAEPTRQGVVLAVDLGANLCVGDHDDGGTCYGAGPGIAVGGSVGYRFNAWLSLTLDASYGTYSIADDAYLTETESMSVTFTAWVHVPLASRVDLDLGIGLGRARWAGVTSTEMAFTWSSWTSFAVHIGFSYRVTPELDLGLAAAFVSQPVGDDLCIDDVGVTRCGEYFGVPDRATVGTRLVYRFH